MAADLSEQSQTENPFFALRPPASDATTYLTFIEHNLSEDVLPTLHEVLQDPELTSTIGWDLVSMLLPLVPASEQCLQDIATLGNPREVVLKVAEALRSLDFGADDGATYYTNEIDEEAVQAGMEKLNFAGNSQVQPQIPTITGASDPDSLPPRIRQFKVLVHMLSVLHPRIKTKFPSRFLSSSLQAVLVAFSRATSHHDDLVQELVAFIKAVSGTKRPHLPSRRSANKVFTRTDSQTSLTSATAAANEPQQDPSDKMLQQRLLQSFLTHTFEDYMASLHSTNDVPGMAWTSRLQEKLQPERVVPGRTTYTQMFTEQDDLHNRSETIGQLIALARDLDMDSIELLRVVMDVQPEIGRNTENEDEPPATAEEIPYSKSGSLYLLAAREVAAVVYGQSTQRVASSEISIFPEHAILIMNFYGPGSVTTPDSEAEPLLDTILALGLLALDKNAIGLMPPDEEFNIYLQRISMLSSISSSANLRGHAHTLTTKILRSHPHDLMRFSFIDDTLEHCPFENLKVSAVEWLREETLAANPASPSISSETEADADAGEDTSLFATPVALSRLSPLIYPDLRDEVSTTANDADALMLIDRYRAASSFRLAALNFLYLLLSAKYLHEPLGVPSWLANYKIRENFLESLQGLNARVRASGPTDASGEDAAREALLLDDAVGRCLDAMKML